MELHDDIYSMPRDVKHKFDQHLMMLDGIGDGVGDIDKRLATAHAFNDKGKKDYVRNELNNLRILKWNIRNNKSILLDAIKNICIDEESALESEKLKDEEIRKIISEVKKKSYHN